MDRNLILVTCDENYTPVLEQSIRSIHAYASRIRADLKVVYGGYPYVERYQAILDIESHYDSVAYLDCDIYVTKQAPNIFEEPYKEVAFVRACPSNNEFVANTCEFSIAHFGSSFDPGFYCFGGVLVGRTESLKKVSRLVMQKWDSTDKTPHHYLMNDEVYLCQVVREFYPDYHQLPMEWLRNTLIDVGTENAYFLHPFTPRETKIEHLRQLNAMGM